MISKRIANALIPDVPGEMVLLDPDGETQDIIQHIFSVHNQYKGQLAQLAKRFTGSDEKKIRDVWAFTRRHIKYVKDDFDISLIKSPAQTWKSKSGDCKSMTIFIGALLYNLGIPYTFRFAGYQGGGISHIYPVAIPGKMIYIVDATLPRFDMEAPASSIIDYDADRAQVATSINGAIRIRGANKKIATTLVKGVGLFIVLSLILQSGKETA